MLIFEYSRRIVQGQWLGTSMFLFALLATATLHEPNPDDIHRFGFNVRPVSESVPRAIWLSVRDYRDELSKPISAWLVYGRELQYAAVYEDAVWRERVWDAVDDMARECCSIERRRYAARSLRHRIGPMAYWMGWLP